jgi:BirA family biotin operon repressor/biotin-[acetyl-CoA-carboxylase] ligase
VRDDWPDQFQMLKGLSTEYNLIWLEQTESTNSEAVRLAAEGCPHLTLVCASEQTRGRGRRERVWYSPPGTLYWSVVLRPGKDWPSQVTIGHVAAVAVGRTILKFCGDEARIHYRWPNDILLDGLKVSGVLIDVSDEESAKADDAEHRYHFDWLVIGVGVNITQHPEEAIYPATSLKGSLKREIPLEEFTVNFSNTFLSYLDGWVKEGFGPARSEFMERAKGLNEVISARLNRQEITGRFLGIDLDAQLILEVDGAVRLLDTGEIFFR